MRQALRNNEQNNLTGYLLREGSTYLNVLEGPRDKVDAALGRISRDRRVYDFQLLYLHPIKERQYPGWSMGYYEMGQPENRVSPIGMFLTDSTHPHKVEPVLAQMKNLGLRQLRQEQKSNNKHTLV